MGCFELDHAPVGPSRHPFGTGGEPPTDLTDVFWIELR